MTVPFVSVVIPTYNRVDFVGEAISSVLGQQNCRVEVLVVDDGSTDRTAELLSSFGDSIRVVRTSGIERGAARNLGVEHAGADLVAFLDSDDYWRPNKLAVQLPYLQEGSASITGVDTLDSSGRVVKKFEPRDDLLAGLTLTNKVFGGGSSIALTKEDFLRVGGFPVERDVQGAEDWIFYLKLLRAGIGIIGVKDRVVCYRLHPANTTADPDRVAACMWAAAHLIGDQGLVRGRDLRRMRARVATVIGRHYTFHRRWKEARRWARRAMEQSAAGEALKGCLMMLGSTAKAMLSRRARVR